jgi:hypothetical protein
MQIEGFEIRPSMTMTAIGDEMLSFVFEFMELNGLVCLKRVCKTFNRVVKLFDSIHINLMPGQRGLRVRGLEIPGNFEEELLRMES